MRTLEAPIGRPEVKKRPFKPLLGLTIPLIAAILACSTDQEASTPTAGDENPTTPSSGQATVIPAIDLEQISKATPAPPEPTAIPTSRPGPTSTLTGIPPLEPKDTPIPMPKPNIEPTPDPTPTRTPAPKPPTPEPTFTPTATPTPMVELTATATAVPTVASTPQLTSTPEAGIKNIKYEFAEGVSEEMRGEIRKYADKFINWLNSETGISLDNVTIFADNNPGRLIEQYLQRSSFSEAQKAQERQKLLNATAFAGQRKDFFVITTSNGWTEASPIIGGPVKEGRAHTIAHELFHLIQMRLKAHQRNFPYWLWEGSAHYIAARGLDENGIYAYEQIREGDLREAASVKETLRSMESTSFYYTGTPYADEYSLARLAVELLVKDLQDGDIQGMAKFWEYIGKGVPWQTAFQDSFGKTPDEFYSEFENWRQSWY